MPPASKKSGPERPTLLVVEDDPSLRRQLKWALEDDFRVIEADAFDEAVKQFQEHRPLVATLDLGLPPHPSSAEEGLRTLQKLLSLDGRLKAIVITGNGERHNAVRAIELGAHDFYPKPVDIESLRLMLSRAVHVRRLEDESVKAQRRAGSEAAREEPGLGDMIGTCPSMESVFEVARRVADTTASVLITGESGTGKELMALELHRLSRRAQGPFVAINCAAIPEHLLESELFGHEKGAFTGAHKEHTGKFELADGGTLLLDEIGEMPMLLQVKLLRVLATKKIDRVGGRHPIDVDVRILAATNVDPEKAMADGKLREDLFYRLSVVTIHLPPLRKRDDDLLLIANALLRRFATEHGREVLGFSDAGIGALLEHEWPGNVRELENRVRRGVIMARSNEVEPVDLDLAAADKPATGLRDRRERLERDMVVDALEATSGNVSKAARQLGISRPTLYERMKKYGLKKKTTKAKKTQT